jgi:hypothetical protein
VAALVGGAQLATASPAAAVSGLQRSDGYSGLDTRPWKRAIATCPADKHVIGGGASVSESDEQGLVRLTSLLPYRDTFQVDAEAPGLRSDLRWSVYAYAICADKTALPQYTIVPGSVTSSKAFQTAAARCPTGTVAFGSGAQIMAIGGPNAAFAQGQIGLQLNRTSGPLDISRATARESAAGYPGQWSLTSYAICAQPRGTIHSEATVTPGATATGSNTCASGFTHGPGGGGGLTDGGPVWLQQIYPSLDKRTVTVAMTGPLAASVGGLVAQQTCAL